MSTKRNEPNPDPQVAEMERQYRMRNRIHVKLRPRIVEAILKLRGKK